MTAPRGNIGPDRDLFEQRFRALEARLAAVEQRSSTLFTGDTNGGIAKPWIPIQLFPKFTVAASTLYLELARAVDTTERLLFEGHIPYLSHPRIQIYGRWGPASGTNTCRYRLKITDPATSVTTTIGTWDASTLDATVQGPYDPTTAAPINTPNLRLQLTAQSLSGSGDYSCQPFSCHLRSTS